MCIILTQHSSVAVWGKVQASVVSARNIGLFLGPRFSNPWLQPSPKNSVTLNTRENCSESTSSLFQIKQQSKVYAIYLWLRPLPRWLRRCFSRNWGCGQGNTFQSSQSNMASGQESQLETKWLGFCLMSDQPKQLPYPSQWTWKARMMVSAQINSYSSEFERSPAWMDTILDPSNAEQPCQGCFPKHSRFSFATNIRMLATRPPILLHALCLVLGWISKGNEQGVRPKLVFRRW